MTVRLKRKSDGAQVEAMFFDGTQTGAVGISAWAGSEGATINMAYRGGDNNDYTLRFEDDGIAVAGDWVVLEDGAFYPEGGGNISTDYDAVTEGRLL